MTLRGTDPESCIIKYVPAYEEIFILMVVDRYAIGGFLCADLDADRLGFAGSPSTLNPKPSTPNPKPSTLNPQPSTLNPQPSTLDFEHQTLNPKNRNPYI